MSQIYNTQGDIATNLSSFFKNTCPFLSKNHLKILPYIIIGMIDSESVVTSDIIKKLKGDFLTVQNESVQRRLRRFFNSNTFDIYLFYDSLIKQIIKNYKPKHYDNRVHISFDHSFCKNKYTILSFSLRIGKQAIPLWFRCFKGKSDPNAWCEDLIINGINYIHELFNDFNYDIIFLADRWFNSTKVMKHIDSLNHKFVIRVKTNIKVLVKHYISNNRYCMKWKFLDEINPCIYHSKLFYNMTYTHSSYKVNIAVSKSFNTDDPWYLVTNSDPRRAIKDYAYRWSIETLFKNEKSNGFYLESTNVRNINAFTTLLGLTNIALIWLTILGADYSKNKHHKKTLITDTKKHKGITKRVLSLFNLGLTYFNLAYNSIIYRRIKYNFILYDI